MAITAMQDPDPAPRLIPALINFQLAFTISTPLAWVFALRITVAAGAARRACGGP